MTTTMFHQVTKEVSDMIAAMSNMDMYALGVYIASSLVVKFNLRQYMNVVAFTYLVLNQIRRERNEAYGA